MNVKIKGYLCSCCIIWILGSQPFCAWSQDSISGISSRPQLAVEKAKANVKKTEQKIDWADSVISTHSSRYLLLQDSISINNGDRKEIDKSYSMKRKVLNKQLQAKDKSISSKAKSDLKILDAEYSSYAKKSDAELKRLIKAADASTRQEAIAQQTKKESMVKLKLYKKALSEAEKQLVETKK